MADERNFLTYADLEARIGVDRVTLWRWARQGHFPNPVKLGPNVVRFRRNDVEAWEASLPTKSFGGPNAA